MGGGHESYGNTWAEQWDSNNNHDNVDDDQAYTLNKINGNKSGKSLTKKFSKKFGSSFNKTKDAASNGMDKTKDSVSTGMKKVKDGASGSFSWVAQKFRKSASKK